MDQRTLGCIWWSLPPDALNWAKKLYEEFLEVSLNFDGNMDLDGNIKDIEAEELDPDIKGAVVAILYGMEATDEDLSNLFVFSFDHEGQEAHYKVDWAGKPAEVLTGILIQHDQSLNALFVENFAYQVIKRFKLPPLGLEFVVTSDKPSPTGYAGHATVVTQERIEPFSTRLWLWQKLNPQPPS